METFGRPIEMVDLRSQYQRLHVEIDWLMTQTLRRADFINGASVKQFQQELANYLGVGQVIGCANGTDALQIAMMGLGLKPCDEVIVPTFTYVATAEVIALLGLRPIWVDVDPNTFTVTAETLEQVITPRTRAIVPVHLFGQCADMAPILKLARAHNLAVIEDAAQAIGALYTFPDDSVQAAGTMGAVGCTSFFPSKNLGCFGDGGALITNDLALSERLRMIANHGQRVKYIHELVGVNSRLDSLQADVLSIKLRHLDNFTYRRQQVAAHYDKAFQTISQLKLPTRSPNSTHVFNQYTIQVLDGRRDTLQTYLKANGVPSMIYYPIPLHLQPAYRTATYQKGQFPVAETLCQSVLSLPIHTELDRDQQEYIITCVHKFFAS